MCFVDFLLSCLTSLPLRGFPWIIFQINYLYQVLAFGTAFKRNLAEDAYYYPHFIHAVKEVTCQGDTAGKWYSQDRIWPGSRAPIPNDCVVPPLPLSVISKSDAAGYLLQDLGSWMQTRIAPLPLAQCFWNSLGSNALPGPGRNFTPSIFCQEAATPFPS